MEFLDRIHPERGVIGFTKTDGTITFYSFIKAIMREHGARRVLDFGAGRGALLQTGPMWKRELADLRQYGATVWAADIDPVVATHPASDEQVVLEIDQPLPFEDGFFDIIVSDFTFEHIEKPGDVAGELLRVLRPGGYICARTPNKYGYAKVATGLVPNRLHKSALRRIQPDRQAQDVFPTFFRMNSVRDIRRAFAGCEVVAYRDSAEPAYFFGSAALYRVMRLVHKLLPDALATSIVFIIRKASGSAPSSRPSALAGLGREP